MRSLLNSMVPVLATVYLTGCAGPWSTAPAGRYTQPSVTKRVEPPRVPGLYTVRKGDTLYSIAWSFGLDYRHLARVNKLKSPDRIFPGQKLWIVAPGAKPPISAEKLAKLDKSSAKRLSTKSQSNTKQSVSRTPNNADRYESDHPIKQWQWPTKGEVVTSFVNSGNKGVNISGIEGQRIFAAADGKVVYSGGGLIGYGELIIIKHNKHYLSAYGHNEKLLVREGDQVKRGQHIASMGQSGSERVMLHFEIRRDGKPVNPMQYLPR